jgi:bifunctional UDP-N-acetylglucosamine pyrophosphorylase/glucosamine-1-phosphate N-acetyltransferase
MKIGAGEIWAGVVMAAGRGTRMKSKVPKVLHKVCGQELIIYPVEALRRAGVSRIVVVFSPETEDSIKGLLGDSVEYVCQGEALGTGHALLQAAPLLKGGADNVLVLNSDSPLIRSATLERLSALHQSTGACVTLLTAASGPQEGLARVLRDDRGKPAEIIEAADLAGKGDALHEVPSEVNGGAYCFRAGWLWDNLPGIEKSPVGEFYLTSLVSMAVSHHAGVEALVAEDHREVLGVNNRVQLAQAEAAMRQRILEHWMMEGVTVMDPASTFLEAMVEIGQDTVIWPNTMILGRSRIGSDCAIGPGSVIQDSVIGDKCQVKASFLEEATLEESVEIGPFSHLRPGAYIERDVHIGNFSEIKNSRLGQGAAMGHFGYVGDASIGAGVNLGAGAVTCNYDGVMKHRTVVEEGAFIGCDTMLVAPVTVGRGAVTGAGSVVTKDVPPGRLAVGVPARIRESKKSPAADSPGS